MPNEEKPDTSILIADDEESVRELLSTMFTKDGHAVYTAATGTEAVRIAYEKKPSLIIMDITMPEMDGYEATSRIKEDPELKETPVIFLTGKSAQEDGGRAFAKGGLTFVRKPFNCSQIRDLVDLTMQAMTTSK